MLQEIIVSQSNDTPKEKSDSLRRSEAKRTRSSEELTTENKPKKKKSSPLLRHSRSQAILHSKELQVIL
ncbi:hypothetical protein CVS40_12133 [Lucilia cuprina]|nr:hypothetical protein CVS40_12133 [Lucilia cuprina]